MKEEIYTIPVNDGFRENCECAFCAMKRKLDEKMMGFILSPSYMEEEVRGETNRLGFCPAHTEKICSSKNVLGMALMMQSQLEFRRAELEKAVTAAGGRNAKKAAEAFGTLRQELSSCYLCGRIGDTMERYFETFFHLWKKDEEFRRTVLGSKGFCLEHFLTLFEKASSLPGGRAEEFRAALWALEKPQLERVQGDLDWFIRKFDYRYAEEPWKESKDALPRTVLKVNGQFTER